jgi:hypothetical protein
MHKKSPELASTPKYDPFLQTVFFEIWSGTIRQAASMKIPSMTSEEAMHFFNTNRATIAGMAARTAPTDGEVKLTIFS